MNQNESRDLTALSERVKEEIVLRVRKVVRPSKIFLFGSAATDEMGPDSDIDLLIITQDAENPRAQSVQIRRKLRGLPFPFDILVKSQEQFDRFKDVVGSIFYTALKHGRVLYG
ncbi:nucleotidyltransferase domain-containing protein [bacterium]|nr:nucleotidyltransferase domain-containing protein [bacterium]